MIRKRSRIARDGERIAAIDIGAAKAACLIAELSPVGDEGCEIDIIGVGQHGSIPGERAGGIEASLRAAIEAAERLAGERVRSAFVSACGRSVGSRRIGVDLDIAGGCVTAEDVEACLASGERLAAAPGFAPLHSFPIRFLVDGEPAGEGPEGQFGNVMTAEVLGLNIREGYLANIEVMLNRCGLELEGVVAGPYAAAEAVLMPDEKDLGVLLVDIGARTTGYALYDRGALIACGGVSVGGEHVTRDIAQIFGAPLGHAERIKALYGSALVGSGDEHRFIEFPQLGDPAEVSRHSRAELAQVIQPRLEEIFEMTLAALPTPRPARSSLRRAVLTGGGSLLVGARETAERVLSVKARLGRPSPLVGSPDAATAPQFAAAMGVLRHVSAERGERRRRRERPLFEQTFQRLAPGGLVGNVGSWLKANF